MMMSKNLLAFVLFATLGAFGSACASGVTQTENDPSQQSQASTDGDEAAADESSDTPVKGDAVTVPGEHMLSSTLKLKEGPFPQPWKDK